MMSKIKTKEVRSNFNFEGASHDYNTRSKNDLLRPQVRTDYGSKRICFSDIRAYNGLPEALREQRNFQAFKRSARVHFSSVINITTYVNYYVLSVSSLLALISTLSPYETYPEL